MILLNRNYDMMSSDHCPICKSSLSNGPTTKLYQKGYNTLLEFSKLHDDTQLTEYLLSCSDPVIVHQECRKSYTNKRRYELKQKHLSDEQSGCGPSSSKKTLRSTTSSFRWKEDCFFCSKPAINDPLHPQRSDFSSVRTLTLRDRAMEKALCRDDQWGTMVYGRLQCCNCLVAEEAVYHRQCISAFFSGRRPPPNLDSSSTAAATSRIDDVKLQFFNELCEWRMMEDSGLVEVLNTCYGSATVGQMLLGKNIARAVRGLTLVYSALSVILLEKLIEIHRIEDVLSDVQSFYKDVCEKEADLHPDSVPDCVQRLDELLKQLKDDLAEKSRTAKFWLQFMYYVEVLLDFIRAERTSEWSLHLHSLHRMLNLFAATGHRNYAKSGRLYLQQMLQLDKTQPWLFDLFQNKGFHSIRRTDRYWAGLSTDLIIEQVMMRSIKSIGGLTHGRGMSDGVRMTWVKSLHRCAGVNSSLNILARLDSSIERTQHTEMGETRRQRDWYDLGKMIDFFKQHDPFDVSNGQLRSLTSGITISNFTITCDDPENVGRLIMLSMDNVSYNDVSIKKHDQVKTFSDVLAKTAGLKTKLPFDSCVLFMRLVTIVQRHTDIEPFFSYELTAYPTALFKGLLVMRKTTKSVFMKQLTADVPRSTFYCTDHHGLSCC